MPRAEDITVSLVGFEKHKAELDLSDDTGFWLRVRAGDAEPFVRAFKQSPEIVHEFEIEQRTGNKTRRSTLLAYVIKIEQGNKETRLLLRPHPSYGMAT